MNEMNEDEAKKKNNNQKIASYQISAFCLVRVASEMLRLVKLNGKAKNEKSIAFAFGMRGETRWKISFQIPCAWRLLPCPFNLRHRRGMLLLIKCKYLHSKMVFFVVFLLGNAIPNALHTQCAVHAVARPVRSTFTSFGEATSMSNRYRTRSADGVSVCVCVYVSCVGETNSAWPHSRALSLSLVFAFVFLILSALTVAHITSMILSLFFIRMPYFIVCEKN